MKVSVLSKMYTNAPVPELSRAVRPVARGARSGDGACSRPTFTSPVHHGGILLLRHF